MDCSPFVQAVLESFDALARPAAARGAPEDRRSQMMRHAATNLRWLAFLRGR